jgi:O-antigen/teichoic acid export membrane protein
MVRYAMPNMPSLIFYALQGQISIYLISIFGNTQNIAEVGALGRLAQMFLILNSFNGTVIEPYMARLEKQKVARSFVLILAAALGICAVICTVGFLTPGILLWLLGPHYSSLRLETGWLLVGGCFTYLVGVVWYMTTARRWVYWSTSWITIALILVTQITYLSLVRIDSTMHAVLFTVASTSAHFLSTLINAAVGFVRGPRIKIEEEPAPHAEPELEIENPEFQLIENNPSDDN